MEKSILFNLKAVPGQFQATVKQDKAAMGSLTLWPMMLMTEAYTPFGSNELLEITCEDGLRSYTAHRRGPHHRTMDTYALHYMASRPCFPRHENHSGEVGMLKASIQLADPTQR